MSYTRVFGGSAVAPSQPSYLALTLSANTALVWPLETTAGQPFVAAEIDVTPTFSGLQLAMPSGATGSTGVATMVVNVGSNSFTVTDAGGNPIATVAVTQAWIISLTDNSTPNGSWRATQLGATVSSATASALAGAGLQANGSLLQVQWIPVRLITNTTLTASYRANAIRWGASTGTLQLDDSAKLGAGWYCAVLNRSSTGTLTITTTGGQTINGGSTFLFPVFSPGGIIICDGTNFEVYGAHLSPVAVEDGGTGATTATGALTNLGGTSIGESIFTAPSAAAVIALLGLTNATFVESTVATDQALNASSKNAAFVCTASLTLTLPLTTTLDTSFVVAARAHSGTTTIAPQATDAINGGSAGASYTLPVNSCALLVTDANGNWYVLFDDLPRRGGTLTGSLTLSAGNIAVNSGTISASGLVTGGTITTAGSLTGGNISTSGTVGASGNIFTSGVFSSFAGASSQNTLGGFLITNGSTLMTVSGWEMASGGTGAIVATPRSVGIEASGAAVVAITFDAVSDVRDKDQIEGITPSAGEQFVASVRPVTYVRRRGGFESGFIAQDMVRAGYAHMVNSTRREGLPELVEDGLTSHKDVQLSLAYDQAIAYLTAALKSALARITALEAAR